jgi:thiol-disulfide isomerase/thioredoxin
VSSSATSGLTVALVALIAASGFGFFRRARDGRLRAVPAPRVPAQRVPAGADTDAAGEHGEMLARREMLGRLGVRPGTPVTLVQFSSAFCAPCRTTRALCADIAARVPGVHHVEVDAESHLEVVRELHILRTPTVLVIDGSGGIVRRASGAPSRAHVLAAVAEVLDRVPAPEPVVELTTDEVDA